MFGSCKESGFNVREDGFRHCEYCGSLHPEDLYELLIQNKVTLGGSDWKYGWPHKFYIYAKELKLSGSKFYNNHLSLELLDEETFNKVAPVISQYSSITWERKEEGKLYYTAPHHGFQRMSFQ